MRYDNLKELVRASSSARRYFLSYPPQTQLVLCEYAQEIHTAADLHLLAGKIEAYRKAIENSEYYDK